MKKSPIGLVVCLVICVAIGCQVHNSDCDSIVYHPRTFEGSIQIDDSLNTGFIYKVLKQHPFSSWVVYCLSADTNTILLNYISSDGNLIRIDLFDSTKVKVLPVRFIKQSLLDMSMQGDSLCLLDGQNKQFYLLAKDSLDRYVISSEVDLSPSFPPSLYIHFSYTASQFFFDHSNIYFSIGDLRDRNFLGEYSVGIFNINTHQLQLKYPYPSCYRNSDIYLENTHFRPVAKNKMIFCYNYTDVIRCFDTLGHITFEVLPSNPERVREFEKQKELNAAYVRKYVNTCDLNLGVTPLDTSGFFVFRRGSTKHLADTPAYYCNYFTQDGDFRLTSIVKPVIARNIIQYKRGFLSLSIDMKSAYVYSLN